MLICFCALSTISISHAYGLRDVIIKDLSSSQNSFSLDLGLLDDYKEGEYAKFFVQTQDYKFPKIFLVAEGKLTKSFPQKSYWYLHKIYLPQFLNAQQHLLILGKTDVKSGRPLSKSRKHIVVNGDQYSNTTDFFDNNQNSVPNRLIKNSDKFESSGDLFEVSKHRNADIEISTFETFKRNSSKNKNGDENENLDYKYFVGKTEVELANLESVEDKLLLDSMTEGIIKKINSQKVPLQNGLYAEQEKSVGNSEINDKITLSSVYEDMRDEKRTKEQISPYAIARIKRDGDLWSSDMDDSALRKYFVASGLEHEAYRRNLALNELDGHEIIIYYSGAVLSHTTQQDQNYQNLGYNLGISYDLHLSRTSAKIKDWSIQFCYEKGVGDYDIGGVNGRMEEGHFGGYLNYYFHNNPLTLNSLIVLGGLGIKSGSASVSALGLTKDYTYQILTLPSIQLLSKYRFRSGDTKEDSLNVGASINAGIVWDFKRLSIIDSVEDNINGKLFYSDIKYQIGMSVFF